MRFIYSIFFLIIGGLSLPAQDLTFSLDQEKASPGDSVRICLSAKNFTDIISMQFTLTWDSTVLEYLKTDNIELPGASTANFNEDIVASGRLPFVWFAPDGEGLSLSDENNLFCLYFNAIGNLGDSSLLDLSNQPTSIEIGRLDGSSINSIPLRLETGKVDIVEQGLEVDAEINAANCFVPPDGSIQLQHQNGVPPFSYRWTGPDNFSAATRDLEDRPPGTYRVSIRDSLGRSAEYSYDIPGPTTQLAATVSSTPTGCMSSTGRLQLNLTGGSPPYTFDLNGNTNNSGLFTGLGPGEYLILITDANNCMLDISASIVQQSGGIPLDLGPDQELCTGDTARLSAPANLLAYRWYQDKQLLSNQGAELPINTEGLFRLEATTLEGCMISDEVNIRFSSQSGSASGDTEIERGDSTQLNASEGHNYQWSPSVGLSCTNCPTPRAAPENTTTYRVQFETPDGCPVMDSVVIRVVIPEDEIRFTPVTFFSPNGDGENDELYFPGLENYQSNDINIYSRWGQLVFSKIDYQLSGPLWDGSLRGKRVPPGVYYYVMRVDEQNITVKRHLTIAY